MSGIVFIPLANIHGISIKTVFVINFLNKSIQVKTFIEVNMLGNAGETLT
jgi:hypothetical protein